ALAATLPSWAAHDPARGARPRRLPPPGPGAGRGSGRGGRALRAGAASGERGGGAPARVRRAPGLDRPVPLARRRGAATPVDRPPGPALDDGAALSPVPAPGRGLDRAWR